MRVRTVSYETVATTAGASGGGEIRALCVVRPGEPDSCSSPGTVGVGTAGLGLGARASLEASATVGVDASASLGSDVPASTAGAGSGSWRDPSLFGSSGLGWSAEGGWVATGGTPVVATSSASGSVELILPPRRAALDVATGGGHRLSSLAGVGVTVDGCACSLDGEIAALSRLVPFGDADLGAGAVSLGDGAISIDLAPAHAALGPSGGASSIAVRVHGGPPPAAPPPLRVHLVIDASTSMRSRWADVKDAALTLVASLRPEDELQIVVYGDDATVAMAPAPVGDGRAARAIVRGLRCGGRTHIESGLRAAYAAAVDDASIVLLLSDGVPLGGAATPAELGRLAAEARAAHGATTFAIGLGAEFHPGILHALATEGGGDFRIAPRASDLEAIFEAALAAHGRIVAHDVTVDLELGAGVSIDASAALAAGLSVDGRRVHLALPQVSAESETLVSIPVIALGGTTSLATASAGWTANGGRSTEAGTLRIAVGATAVPAGGMAIALDADLGRALAEVAVHVENGEAALARARLEAHAALVEATLAVHAEAALTERAHAARALGLELEALIPGASFLERRETASAMLEWSLQFSR